MKAMSGVGMWAQRGFALALCLIGCLDPTVAGSDAAATDSQSADRPSDAVIGARCPRGCEAVEGASMACVGGVCSFVCAEHREDCDGVPGNGCEASLVSDAHCGGCGVTCSAGTTCRGGNCEPITPATATVRLVAPRSTSRLWTQRPMFRWRIEGTAPSEEASVELCRTRDCRVVDARVTGRLSAEAPRPLAPGRWFWRVQPTRSGQAVGAPSATWLFTVPLRSTTLRAETVVLDDFDSDGYADLRLPRFVSATSGTSRIYRGGPRGIDPVPAWVHGGSSGSGPGALDEFVRWNESRLEPAGDLDGDGFNDTIVHSVRSPYCEVADGFIDGRTGTLATRRGYLGWIGTLGDPSDLSGRLRSGLGVDLDDDGFIDSLLYRPRHHDTCSNAPPYYDSWWTVWGGHRWPASEVPMDDSRLPFDEAFYRLAVGDFDGDGLQDATDGARWHRGGTGRVASRINVCVRSANDFRPIAALSLGDYDGDGYDDAELVFRYYPDDRRVSRGGPAGLTNGPCTPPEQTEGLAFGAVPVGDFDGDGYPDAFSAREQALLLGGPARPLRRARLPARLILVAAPGDVHGDGYDDLIMTGPNGMVMLRGRSDAMPTAEVLALAETRLPAATTREVPADPRPVSPRSSHRLATRRPLFRWRLPPRRAVDAVRVELCRQRTCPTIVDSVVMPTTQITWRPSRELDRGAWFWRIQGLREGRLVGARSPTWMFVVPRVDLAPGMDRPMQYDLDSDGFEDVVVPGKWSVAVYSGGASVADRPLRVFGPGRRLVSLGDIDGDGFNDTLVTHTVVGSGSPADGETLWSARGGSWTEVQRLPTPVAVRTTEEVVEVLREALGDVDDDGFADVSLHVRHRRSFAQSDTWRWMPGGPGIGLLPVPGPRLLDHAPMGSDAPIAAAGDLDGDGVPDLRLAQDMFRGGGGAVFEGDPAPMGVCPGTDILRASATVVGDVTGDGYGDLLYQTVRGFGCGLGDSSEYILPGGPSVRDTPACQLVSHASRTTVHWQWSVGDLDGDGRHDFLTPTGTGFATAVELRASATGSQFAVAARTSVVALGDINGDGYDDLLVLSVSQRGDQGHPGPALYLGGPGGAVFSRQL